MVDIYALNHPNSGLVAGGDLKLRSGNPVVGDAHYWSRGNFGVEQLDGTLLGWGSIDDPVIWAAGDVAFDSYTGASLHILAGGSVEVPGTIEITGPDRVNGLVETVVLSDGSTVEIDGGTAPTLDVRAGTLAVNPGGAIGDVAGFVPGIPETGGGATSADITIGSIRNEGGMVFLTNQYQPDVSLPGGDIQIGTIDTSATVEMMTVTAPLMQMMVQSGDVVMDARGGIEVPEVLETDVIDTSAQVTVNLTGVTTIGDFEVDARGGNIHLIAQESITTGNFNTSAMADMDLNAEQITGADVISGGQIGDLTLSVIGGSITLDSTTSIGTGNLDSSARADANADVSAGVDAMVNVNVNGGEINNITLTTIGGAIALDNATSIETGNLTSLADADVWGDAGVDVDAGVDTRANVNVNLSGGSIGDVSMTTAGGAIALASATSVETGDLTSWASTGPVAYANIYDSPVRQWAELNGGTIGNMALNATGGTIVLNSAASIETGTLNASAYGYPSGGGTVQANARVLRGGSIGDIMVTTIGGQLTLDSATSIATGDLKASAESFGGFMDVDARYSGPNVDINISEGGTIGDVLLTTTGGAIAMDGDTSITTGHISSWASVDEVSATAIARPRSWGISDSTDGSGGTIGDFSLTTTGGTITIDDAMSITTGHLSSWAEVNGGAFAYADRSGGIIGNVTGTATGGAIALESANSIETGAFSSRAFVSPGASAHGDISGGIIGNVTGTATGGAIALNSANSITVLSDSYRYIDAAAHADAFLDASADMNGGTIGDVSMTATGGAIALDSANSITILNSDRDAMISSAYGRISADGKTLGNLIVIANAGEVNLNAQQGITIEGHTNASTRADVNTDGGEPEDVTVTASGGAIGILSESGQLTLSEGSEFRTNVLDGDGNGGDIQISGESVQLTNNLLTTTVIGVGKAGDITFTIKDNAVISGSRLLAGREPGAEGQGTGGDIIINAGTLALTDFSFLNTATLGTGNAGNVELTTTQGDVVLKDSSIFSLTAVEGDAGSITVQSAGALRLEGNSAISTTVALGSTGEGGNIRIDAQDGVFITGIGERNTNTAVGTQPNLTEIEHNGGSFHYPYDDDLADAQSVDMAFGVANNPNVLFSTAVPYVAIAAESGDDSYDVYSFSVDAVGTQITFDIDEARASNSTTETLNTMLRLYNEQGNELAFNDDAPVTLGSEGSTSLNDPFLTYIFNEPGTYFIRVSELINEREGTLRTPGTYNLNISRVDDFLVSSGITTQTRSSGRSGDITIDTPIIDIQNGGLISTETLSSGQAGNITLQPLGNGQTLSITLQGGSSQISGSTMANGASGNLTIKAPESITLQGNGRIAVETSGAGNGGELRFDTGTLAIQDGMNVSGQANERSTGRAGSIVVDATDRFTISAGSALSVETQGQGRAGDVTINTPLLTVASDAAITATATATAAPTSRGGSIFLNASTMDLAGSIGVFSETQGQAPAGSLELNPYETGSTLDIILRNDARVSASTTSVGQGGNLSITAPESIDIQGDGKIAVETTGSGNAGSLNLTTQALTIDDGALLTAASSGIGSAGGINIDVRHLILQNEAQASVSSAGGAIAGDLHIIADQVFLKNQAALIAETDTGRGANITLDIDDHLSLTNNSRISASTTDGEGGSISLDNDDHFTNIVRLRDGSAIATTATGIGNAGRLNLNTNTLTLHQSDIDAATNTGEGGNIRLNVAETLSLQNGSGISATTQSGTGGDIVIREVDRVSLRDSSISSSAQTGEAGNLKMTASERITLSGTTENRGGLLVESHQGEGGELIIATSSLVMEEGSDISASTNTGTAGNITINVADLIHLTDDGTELAAQARRSGGIAGNIMITTEQITVEDGASILATNRDASNGGSITLNRLETLTVNRGRISAATEGGVAGNLSINATDAVQLTNRAVLSVETISSQDSVGLNRRGELSGSGRRSFSTMRLRTTDTSIPQAGNLDIKTNRLVVKDGSSILVSSPNGQAGNISINSHQVELDNGSIRATTSANANDGGESANITLSGLNGGLDLLLLNNSSLISAEALAGANGGNITLNARDGFIIAPLNANSDLIANAIGGNGGRIAISALQLFGFQVNPGQFETLRTNQTNDISVSSTLGTDGVITVDDLGIDPVQAVGELPTNTTPLPLSQGCQAVENQGEFINTGRGGLYTSPFEFLSDDTSWEDIQLPRQATTYPSEANYPYEADELVEAKTWHISDDGDIILTNVPTENTLIRNCQIQSLTHSPPAY